MSTKHIAVALDGPAGAGKSTLAKRLAEAFGYLYVDTGALYRTIGLYFIRKGFADNLPEHLDDWLPEIHLDLTYQNGEQRVLLCGEDVSEEIRTPLASRMASDVSAKPEVRAFLLQLQRDLAETHDVVMDGRDIGTVVLPNATVKIFLTASAEERANRRYRQLKEKGSTVSYEEVLADMKQRDYNDSHRAIAPLKPAEDSILADTTQRTAEESLSWLIDIVKGKIV